MTFKRNMTIFLFLFIAFMGVVFIAMSAGSYDVGVDKIFAVIGQKIWGNELAGVTPAQEVIIWRIRLPRLALAVASGMALAVSGTAYQGCFRNPLVEPYILGVSSGAACGAALAIIFPEIFPQGQIMAFVFALAAVSISYSLARSKGYISPVALVLSGVIVGALFMAVVGIMKYLAADTQLREITFWMMGGLYYATWDDAVLNIMSVVPVTIILWFFSWHLNVLSLGDAEVRSLGLNPGITRFFVIVASTFAAAISVSSCGIIAWVGLMTPHAARLMFGSDHRWVIPGAALLGAMYLLVCDTVARTLTPAEIPLGIVTAILGAPYLLWLLRSKGRALYGM